MTATETKKQLKRRVLFTGMFIVAMVIIMISVSFSWFNNGKTANVKGLTVEAPEANNLQIRASDGEWKSTLVFPMPEGFVFPAVAGNGTNFHAPVIEQVTTPQEDGSVIFDYEVTGLLPISEAQLSEHVLICDFALRIDNPHTLYLSADSTVTRGSSASPRDYASRVLRVALMVKEESGYRMAVVWIPDVAVLTLADYHTVDLTSEATEDGVVFVDAAGKEYTLPIEGASGSTEQDGILYVWGEMTERIRLTNLPGELQEREFRAVVWVDGLDEDCTNSVMGGDVFVDLHLAVEKLAKEPENPEENPGDTPSEASVE